MPEFFLAALAEASPIDVTVDVPTRLARWLADVPESVEIALLLAAPLILAFAIHFVLYVTIRRVLRPRKRPVLSKLMTRVRGPTRFLAILLGGAIAAGLLSARGLVPEWLDSPLTRTLTILGIVGVTWAFIALIASADDLIRARYRTDVADNLRARGMHTRVAVISRVLMVIVALVGIATILMMFEQVEQYGASLLASAGVAGIVVGFAARPVLGNIIAGIQIALAQPIRLDDAVVIDGEWGWVEEITATYVVVRIWDQRRLIVPFSKIIEEPFQNWTRRSAEILGSVVLYVDYSCPVEEVRAELDRILEGHPKFDGRAKVLQTIDATEKCMVLRALVTAKDSPTAWELRCDVRERLIGFLQRQHPYCLPREREVTFRAEQAHAIGFTADRTEREMEDPTLRLDLPPSLDTEGLQERMETLGEDGAEER